MFAALLLPATGAAFAQETQDEQATTDTPQARTLDRVTVTGSLIPQTEIETFTPVTVISAEDIQMRGFTGLSEVLQQSSYQTGGLQGGQTSASFTQGAEAAGMFGLDPGYTKYLINGRPMANYPALYNGSDTFNNISGIPIDLVERIEILPGGQSSLYGSDAIAGVVNVILKKDLDHGVLTVRGGAFSEGGGSSVRFSLADSFSAMDGRLNVLAGVQYETRDPIWGYQRDLTDKYNNVGYTPATASRDYLVYGYSDIANQGFGNYGYVFADPNDCANVTGQFGGTEGLQNRPGFGEYCGSFITPGYRTIRNGKDSGQLYTHATFDVSNSFQLYGDLLYSYESVENATGSNYTWWGTGAKYGYYYDPDFDALLNLQRAFSPEDIGGAGYRDIMNTDRSNSYMLTLGGNGIFGDSNWEYDVGLTRTEYKLTERSWVRWADPIDDYFTENVLGPQLGMDPYFGAYPVFQPDYAAFYTPMSPVDFASFTGYATTESKTWDNMLRAQVTNSELFSLPGGNAGLAVVVEGGNQGWDYSPDPRLIEDPVTLESEVWGQTSVSGSGHRSRYAVTGELRMPLLEPLTVTLSGRYDAFDVASNTTDKPTYSIGLEYRPVQSLLFRGKYGTAFRAPTLSDVFQGISGYYSSVTDYYRCWDEQGYAPGNTDDCTYDSSQFFGQQSGNPDLEPIEADVWNAGVVWAPTSTLSMSVDYYSWDIENEVDLQSAEQLALLEYFCRTGQADMNSQACQAATTWIVRGATGAIETIYTPKVNVAQQKLEAVTASLNWVVDIGRFGSLAFAGNYTNNLEHTVRPLPDSPDIDLLRDPYYMWIYDAYAKTRADASVAWNLGKWTTTLYANRIGKTPNYLAYLNRTFDYEHSSGEKAGWWKPYTTYNMSVNYTPIETLQFSLMANNVFNDMPDHQANNHPGTTGTPYNNYFYNTYGRAIYFEARYKFGASN
ncbi:TonB-dependent receptor plug domain-containing protein [Luteimonas salinilitoris]|uniref:TonB-dependent receptor plug domain-containing protein n=1 Tax=Luteimonas salinilitoris TaxID=3237697 RepID=A0ABV4HJU3_9GAMM